MEKSGSVRDTAIRVENGFGFIVYRWDQEYKPYRRRSLWDDLSHSGICPLCTGTWDPWISRTGTQSCPFCHADLASLRTEENTSWEDVDPVTWSLEKTRYREIFSTVNWDNFPPGIPGWGDPWIRTGRGVV